MLQFIADFLNYLQTTPPDLLANWALFWITPVLIFCILVWGFLELWLDRRQDQFNDKVKWVLMQVSVPKEAIQTPKGIENFFTSISGIKSGRTFKEKWFDGKQQPWLSFELTSHGGRIAYYIRCRANHRDVIETAFYSQYPEAQFTLVEDYVAEIPTDYPNDDTDIWGSELNLKKDNYLPLRTWESFEHTGEKDIRFKDPLMNVLEALGNMRDGENLFIQLLIRPPEDQDWTKTGQKFIDKTFGKPEKAKPKGILHQTFLWLPLGIIEQTIGLALGGTTEAAKQDDFKAFKITPFEKEQIDAVNLKITKVGWEAKIRFVYWARKEVFRKGTVAPMMKGMFAQYGHQSMNSLAFNPKSTPTDDYPWQAWTMPTTQKNLAARYKNRSCGSGANMSIMNTEELATIWHFPSFDSRTPVLTSVGSRQAEAPVELGFALPGAAVIQNLDRSPEGLSKSTALPPRKPLSVPSPMGGSLSLGADPAFATPGMPVEAPVTIANSRPTPMMPETMAPQPATLPILPADESRYMPRPGMPAPLPPGLDLNDQSLPPGAEMPKSQ